MKGEHHGEVREESVFFRFKVKNQFFPVIKSNTQDW